MRERPTTSTRTTFRPTQGFPSSSPQQRFECERVDRCHLRAVRFALVLLLVASCHRTERESPAAPKPPPPSTRADAAAPTAPVPIGISQPGPPRTEANDDLPHRRAQLTPLLATAHDCVPRANLLGPEDEPVTLALDTFDGHLVACAQVITRRGGSVFLDPVSYACWNIDPKTAAVTRRADLARSYLRCQAGGCAPYEDRTVTSYEGTEQLTFDDAKHELAITTRAGAAVRSFASPPELAGAEPLRGDLTYVDHTIFAVAEQTVLVLDDHGRVLGHAAGRDVHVIDAGHVLVAQDDQHATLYDLATHATRRVQLPAPYAAEAVRFHDALYVIDDARQLAVLDPGTFRVRQTRPLAVCQ